MPGFVDWNIGIWLAMPDADQLTAPLAEAATTRAEGFARSLVDEILAAPTAI